MNKTETLEQKKRRLVGKINFLDTYLKTLNKITLKKIDSTMLLSVVETDRLYSTNNDYNIDYRITLDFNAPQKIKEWDKIKSVFGSKPLYIWLTNGEYCGLCPLESIEYFNINFDYEDDSYGIIVLIVHDFTQKVVLDFYEEDGEKKIDIEIKSVTKLQK